MKVRLFDIQIDAVSMDEAVHSLQHWLREGVTHHCRYVVTPNVDHAVKLQQGGEFSSAYRDADLVVVDSQILVWVSRLFGRPLPERVAGSDLVPALFSHLDRKEGCRVFLLGAAKGVGEHAAAAISERWPLLTIAGTYSPPSGFEEDPEECERILQQIESAKPDLLLVGLGAPKQECFVHKYQERICAKVALCVGATIDFLAGEEQRAPSWMQKAGLEWFHRLLRDPKRLAGRYFYDLLSLPGLLFREFFAPSRR